MLFYLSFFCMYSNKKRKCYQFYLNATSRKSQKLIPRKTLFSIAKFGSRRTQKISRQSKIKPSHKFSATRFIWFCINDIVFLNYDFCLSCHCGLWNVLSHWEIRNFPVFSLFYFTASIFQFTIIKTPTPFQVFLPGSFVVQSGDHLRSGIICGPIWGSFPVGDHLRSRDHLRRCTDNWQPFLESCKFPSPH